MRGYTLPKWLVAVLLLAAGAGAAVGPVMAARLTGRVNIVASQAISVRNVPTSALPLWGSAPLTTATVNATDPSRGLIAQQPGVLVLTPFMSSLNCYNGIYNMSVGGNLIPIPGNARSYVSLNDTGTDFTIAIDLLPTSSKFDIAIPLYNSANNQQLAELTLDIPDGVMVDLEQIQLDASPPIPGTNMAAIGRTSANTWEVRLQPNLGTYYDFIAIPNGNPGEYMAAPASGIIVHVALANGTPPGFYAIRGKLQAQNR